MKLGKIYNSKIARIIFPFPYSDTGRMVFTLASIVLLPLAVISEFIF